MLSFSDRSELADKQWSLNYTKVTLGGSLITYLRFFVMRGIGSSMWWKLGTQPDEGCSNAPFSIILSNIHNSTFVSQDPLATHSKLTE